MAFDLGLENKVVVITGGATGIGFATGLEFARQGAHVAICGRSEAKLAKAREAFAAEGFELFTEALDVCDAEKLYAFGDHVIEKFGRLDVWMNNAGIAITKPLLEFTEEEWNRVLDLNLKIGRGEIFGFIGPNGAGKSTVMGMLSRLIARDSGLVDFEGTEITRWKSRELSKRLAILTQANNVQMKLTVRELVAFGRFPYSGGRLTQEDNEIIDRAIAYMELGDFEEQFIDELSGGQRQRAYIAMVIAQDTEYILLDEPTNNLDIYHATNLMRIVRRLCDELGKTVILVLHEINYAAFYSDYICAFVDGKIAKFGTVQEVITKENLSDIYKVDFEIMQIEGKPLSIYY